VRCLVLQLSDEAAKHLNRVRSWLTGFKPVPDSAYDRMRQAAEPPAVQEGFTAVSCVPFVPAFDSTTRVLVQMWT
jgi:hypothetical protein